MKSKKLFELSYVLNFISSVTLISMMLYTNSDRKDDKDYINLVIVLSTAFLLAIAPFNWMCYYIHKAYKSNQLLSKRIKIAGTIVFILFSVFTILVFIGSFYVAQSIYSYFKAKNYYGVFASLVLFTITATGLYSCLGYWIIRKRIKAQFVNAIAELGNEPNS